ncbi:hypothetical protein [Kitasatospora aureofaciens]|uniref:hypothetical protein n=1 Tax=Kitasatospora aureofaciens TaxID=1894 RepID=UPI0036F49C4D
MTFPLPSCRAHGPGPDCATLVGRRFARIVAAWHVFEGRRDPIPVDLWLVDGRGRSVRLASGTDRCGYTEAGAEHVVARLGALDLAGQYEQLERLAELTRPGRR